MRFTRPLFNPLFLLSFRRTVGGHSTPSARIALAQKMEWPRALRQTLLAVCLYSTVTGAANSSTALGHYVAQGLGQTSTTSVSTTTSSQAAAASDPLVNCPRGNNTQISTSHGVTYHIYCDAYLPSANDTLAQTYTTQGNYSECAPECDQINGCTGFTWSGVIGAENIATCSFRMSQELPLDFKSKNGSFAISARRLGSGTGLGDYTPSSGATPSRNSSKETSTRSRSLMSDTLTITSCAAYQTAFPDNTLGWLTTGPNLTWPGAVSTWDCWTRPCNLICADDTEDCITSGSSYAASCAPQWSAYSCSYSSYVSEHITGNFTSTWGDIFTSIVSEYPSTSTADTSFTFYEWGGATTVITPVYVFGTPTPVSTIVSTASYYGAHTVPSSADYYWSSTTDVVSTYGTTYTTAYLDLFEIPLTHFYPTPTPACSITEVYSATCDDYCNIYGGTVEVYYWPGVTPGPDGNFPNTTKPSTPSTTEVDGVTMTSPSVYVSFQSLYAADSCRRVGSEYTGSILAFDPASISTVYGGPGFLSADVPDGASVFNFGDLGPTVDAAAYERQVNCVVDTGCKTIYPDYKPTISVPSEVRALDPAWASCYPDFRGFYDPPKALGAATTVPGPGGYTSATPSPTPVSPMPTETGGVTTAKETSAPQTPVPVTTGAGTTQKETSKLEPSGTEQPKPPGAADGALNGDSGEDPQPSEATENDSPTAQDGSAQSDNPHASTNDPAGAQSSSASNDNASNDNASNNSEDTSQPSENQSSDDNQEADPAVAGDGSNDSQPTDAASASSQDSDSGSAQDDGSSELGSDDVSSPSQTVDTDSSSSSQNSNGDPALDGDGSGQGSSSQNGGGDSSNPSHDGGSDPSQDDDDDSRVVGSGVLTSSQDADSDPGSGDDAGSSTGSTGDQPGTDDASSDAESDNPNAGANAPAFTMHGTTITADAAGDYVIDSSTLTAGSSSVVVDGITYTLATSSSAIVLNSAYPTASVPIAGHTISPGSQTVIEGTTYSVDRSGSAVVINGITKPARNGYFVVEGQTYSEGPSTRPVVEGQTLSPGSQTVIGHTTYFLGPSGSALVVNGVTQTLQPVGNAATARETDGGSKMPSQMTGSTSAGSTEVTDGASMSSIAAYVNSGGGRRFVPSWHVVRASVVVVVYVGCSI